jgi:hypothetical protein
MSLPATIAQAIMDTVIGRLAVLFLAVATDMAAARDAARQMLAAYNAETPDEITLAAEIISLQLHTLEALSHAADPELSLNKILRLRGSAVSLSRESHKAQRKLDQLQRTRRAGITAQPAQAPAEVPTPAKLTVQTAVDLVATARQAIKMAKNARGPTWSQSFQKRQTAERIAAGLKKKQAEQANAAAPSAHATPQAA